MDILFDIIHEDDELLVINKPADLVCHPTKGDEYSSLISRVRLHLGPEATPRMVNRLDRETSGVVVVAKTAAAAGELGRVWETRAVQKEYLAIVHGHVGDEVGLIDVPLGKDESSRVVIKDCVRVDGMPAQTEFQVLRRISHPLGAPSSRRREANIQECAGVTPALLAVSQWETPCIQQPTSGCQGDPERQPVELAGQGQYSLLRVLPRTGRKHQIRIHLAHLGHPIVGDKLYGGDEDLYLALVERRLTEAQRARLILPHHALHAAAVRFPWRGSTVEFRCAPEKWFLEFVASPESG